MDVFVTEGGFAVNATSFSNDVKYEWQSDGSLLIRSKKENVIHVWDEGCSFLEAIDENGNIEDVEGHIIISPKSKTKLRIKRLPNPKLSKKQIAQERKSVTRHVFCDSPYSVDMPENAVEFISWLQKHIDEIPADCRDTANFEFDQEYSYGERYPRISLSYSQPETDKEVIERIKIYTERRRREENRERQKLELLKAKFDPPQQISEVER